MSKETLAQENVLLRAYLAHGSDPCVYCGLSKMDMPKCAHGFPGCGRADDIQGHDNPWAKNIDAQRDATR